MCNPPVIFNKLYPKRVNLIGMARNWRRPLVFDRMEDVLMQSAWTKLLRSFNQSYLFQIPSNTPNMKYSGKNTIFSCWKGRDKNLYDGTTKRYHFYAILDSIAVSLFSNSHKSKLHWDEQACLCNMAPTISLSCWEGNLSWLFDCLFWRVCVAIDSASPVEKGTEGAASKVSTHALNKGI